MNFLHIQCDCQNFTHILNYLISQPLVSKYPPQQKPQSPTPRRNSQNIHLPRQTQKKYLSLSCSAPMARLFETIPVDTGQKGPEASSVPLNSRYQQTSTKTRPDSTSAQNIDSIKLPISTTSQILKPAPKILTTGKHNLWTTLLMLSKSQVLD